MEARVIRVAMPMLMNASTVAGRMRCESASTVYGMLPAIRESSTLMWVYCGNGGAIVEYSPREGSPMAGPMKTAAMTAPRYVGVAQPLR